MGEQKTQKVSEDEALKQAEEQLKILEEAKAKVKEEPIKKDENTHADSTAGQAKAPVQMPRQGKAKIRSKKYQEVKSHIDKTKTFPIEEAIELAQKTSYTKFDGSIEVHLRTLAKKTAKGIRIEQIRGLIEFPHSTGKKTKVGIIDEKLAEQILKDKSTDFDVLLVTPEMMPKIARLAKILGPSGKMPNPKAGTITANPEETKKKIEAGRVEYKSDKGGIIHMVIGKASFDKAKIVENFNTLLAKIGKDKLQSIYINSTMGPSIRVEIK